MTDNARSLHPFLPMRPVEFQILLGLCQGERHGYGLLRDADAEGPSAATPKLATFYRALQRMERAGLVSSTERPHAPGDDKRRRYYKMTALGLRVARAEAVRLQSLVRTARSHNLIEDAELV